jgi:hypothetical protein
MVEYPVTLRKGLAVADEKLTHWVGVIAKSLAYLALHAGASPEKNLGKQAMFLEALGFTTEEQAGMLGSTPASITELKGRLRRRKKGGNGASSKKKSLSGGRRAKGAGK